MITDEDKEKAIHDKRYHLRITSLCNNNCNFCLAGDMPKTGHFSFKNIINQMQEGLDNDCTRLILSGGEPSIYPNFPKIIRVAKHMGYNKIQTISNGRMFSYKSFLNDCVNSGLNEITFSIHGPNAKIHDALTRSKGSFNQICEGIKNALESGIIVSSDVVVNKINYKYFPQIIELIYEMGVMEIDILQIIPFGNAWDNWNILNYDLNDAIPFLHKGFRFAKEHDIVIWTNRFPPEYLFGFEDLIQDTAKLVDEMHGRNKQFSKDLESNKKPNCYGKRCQYCYLNDFCLDLFKTNDLLKNPEKITLNKIEENTIELKNNNLDEIKESILGSKDKLIINLPPPGNSILNYKKASFRLPTITKEINKFTKKNKKKICYKNIPPCIGGIENNYATTQRTNSFYLKDNKSIDIIKFAQEYSWRRKIKGLKCKECIHDNICEGIYQKYIEIYGFSDLQPFLDKSKLIE